MTTFRSIIRASSVALMLLAPTPLMAQATSGGAPVPVTVENFKRVDPVGETAKPRTGEGRKPGRGTYPIDRSSPFDAMTIEVHSGRCAISLATALGLLA